MAIPLYKFIDKWIGTPICWILGTISKVGSHPTLPPHPKRILIIKLWALGDSIVMLPLINAIRKRYPSSTIDILCRHRNKEVFELIEGVNSIHLFEKNHIFSLISLRRHYDLVIDGEPYLRLSAIISWYLGAVRIGWGGFARSILYTHTIQFKRTQHMVHNYLDMAQLLGAHYTKDTLVSPIIPDMDQRHVTMAFESRGINSGDYLIAASPSVAESSKSRQWLAERFATVLDTLVEQRGARILFIGGPLDLPEINEVRNRMKHPSITLAGQLNLAQTFEVLSRCKFVLSVDTGTMHAAASVGVPTIGLFGPNIPTLWAPYGPKNRSIYHAVECSPCIINEKGQMPDCLRKTDKYLCMHKITVEEVVKAAEETHARYYQSMLHGKHTDQNTRSRPISPPH